MKAFRHLAIIGCVLGLALIGTGIWLTIEGQPSAPKITNTAWSKHSEEVHGKEYLALVHQGVITDQSGQKLTDCVVRFSLEKNGKSVWHYDEDAPFGIFNFRRRVPISELPSQPWSLDFECEILSYQSPESSLPTLGIVLILGGFVVIFVGIGLARHLAEKAEAAGEDHPA